MDCRSTDQLARILAYFEIGGKPARLVSPPGPGEGRVIVRPVNLRRRPPLGLRLRWFRRLGKSEAEFLWQHLDLFVGGLLLPHVEGGNRMAMDLCKSRMSESDGAIRLNSGIWYSG